MEEEIITPEEEVFDYNKLRYILDKDGYLFHASFGGLIICDLGECTEYIGDIPEGYSTIEEWFEGEADKLNAWKIVDDNLVFDENKYNELEQIHKIEEEENSCASKKYVNDTLKKSTAVVTDELANEVTGTSLIILDDAGNYEIPFLKVKSDTAQNIEVVSSNKNILGIDAITSKINGVNITINTDGTIKLNGTANDYIEFNLNGSNANKEMLFLIKNNIDYVISGLTNNVSLSLYSFDGTDRTLVGNYTNELINLSNTSKVTQVTLNITSGAEFKNVVIAPQIEIDNVATEFIKHEETKAYGILENNECIIENLVSYLDKTIIMIDNDVESSIQYYRYKYINEKLVEIEINEEEVRSTLKEVNNTVEGQNQKISEVTQKVGELSSKISEVAEVTTSRESISAKVEVEGINQSEPIYIQVHPTKENISYLYPHSNLFPSATLYPKVRTLRFTNTETKEVIDYELPTDLLFYDDETYDEFILDYDMQICAVNKRVGYNIDGTTYVLETPTTINYEYPKIVLTDGDYIVELLGYDNAYLLVRLMAQNIYTTQFATKAEVTSEISQTAQQINLEVSKKVGEDEVISKINQSAEAVQIDANKINLNGKEINLTSDNILIKSSNFNVDSDGNMSCNNANITGGLIDIKSQNNYTAKIKLSNENQIDTYTAIYNFGLDTKKDGKNLVSITNYTFDNTETYYGLIRVGATDGSSETVIRPTAIFTPNLTQTSKESVKKNIVEYNEKALDIVKDSTIYEYNFKSERDGDKKHIGFVIGDKGGEYKTPEQVISNDREGIESYSMTSILWKAVQEQQELIEQLQNEIKEMKGERKDGQD